jgi:hypothetical protein
MGPLHEDIASDGLSDWNHPLNEGYLACLHVHGIEAMVKIKSTRRTHLL